MSPCHGEISDQQDFNETENKEQPIKIRNKKIKV